MPAMGDKGTVFVTGGSGFVGRNLIGAFVDAGWTVVALARSERSQAIVEGLGARGVRGDVLDSAALTEGMQGCDLLVHAAADTDHGQGSSSQTDVNVEGTRVVLEAAKRAGVRRAIHISTEAVLADGAPLVDVDETHPIPNTHAGSYSRTKAAAERAALAANDDRLAVVVVRPRFVWGRDDTTALPALVEAAKTGKLKWIDGGTYRTSTTHVANLAAGVLAAAERGRAGEVYFLTDGDPVEFRWFATELLATQGVAPPSGSVPRWVVKAAIVLGELAGRLTSGRLGPPMSRQEYGTIAHEMTVRDDKARRELGYRPVLTIAQGLEELR